VKHSANLEWLEKFTVSWFFPFMKSGTMEREIWIMTLLKFSDLITGCCRFWQERAIKKNYFYFFAIVCWFVCSTKKEFSFVVSLEFLYFRLVTTSPKILHKNCLSTNSPQKNKPKNNHVIYRPESVHTGKKKKKGCARGYTRHRRHSFSQYGPPSW